MKIYHKDDMDLHYMSIYEQNKEKLLKGGVGDAFLMSPENDTRMSLALLIRINVEISEKIWGVLKEFKDLEPDLYYYPKKDFHITVMDILGGKPNRNIPDNIENYIQCIRECADKIEPFYIAFNGMIASDNAVLVKGFYEYGLEELRQSLRKKFADNHLLLEERYKTISSHITTIRIPDKLNHSSAFIKCIDKDHEFGKMLVNALELTFHNWYDSKKTILASIDLHSKS